MKSTSLVKVRQTDDRKKRMFRCRRILSLRSNCSAMKSRAFDWTISGRNTIPAPIITSNNARKDKKPVSTYLGQTRLPFLPAPVFCSVIGSAIYSCISARISRHFREKSTRLPDSSPAVSRALLAVTNSLSSEILPCSTSQFFTACARLSANRIMSSFLPA